MQQEESLGKRNKKLQKNQRRVSLDVYKAYDHNFEIQNKKIDRDNWSNILQLNTKGRVTSLDQLGLIDPTSEYPDALASIKRIIDSLNQNEF